MRWSPSSWMRTPGTAWVRPARTAQAPAAVETDASSEIRRSPAAEATSRTRAWHDSYVPVVFLITIVAVLVGIFFAATGRGGELAYEHADHAPLDLGPVSAADIALLRPPTAMWGYNMQVTDEALDRIARAMRERDVTIAYLQEQLATLARDDAYAEPRGVYAPGTAGGPLAPEVPPFAEASEISEAADVPESPQAADVPEFPDAPESPQAADVPEFPDAPESPQAADVPEFPDAPESPQAADVPEFPDAPESPQAPEAPESPDTPSLATGQSEEPSQTPKPPQTPLVLKASPAKAPPPPEPHEATQPSETLRGPADPDATQPSETLPPHETQGPQGAFDTHDWWAEQERVAREEAARRHAAGPSGVAGDDSMAAAEEQGW